MNISLKTTLTAGALLVLAACGGSSGNDVPTRSIGTNDPGLTVTRNEADNTVTVSDGTRETVFDSGDENGPITQFIGTTGASDFSDFVIIGDTPSGAGQVRVINSTIPGEEVLVVEIDGTDTLLPTVGGAIYFGDYLGQAYAKRGDDDEISVGLDSITGDVSLTASFDDGTISGDITNRDFDGDTLADLTLELTSISNGGFAGTASGGAAAGASTSNGSFIGLFTGDNAEEVIGGLSIDHSGGSFDVEVGVFIAEQDIR